MNRSARSHPVLAVLLLIALITGACSSDDDSSEETQAIGSTDSAAPASDDTDSADEGDSTDSSDDGESAGAALTCDEAAEPSALIRGANGWIGQVVDAQSAADIGGDTDAVLAAIEALRPIQDIEGVLGSMREGLDNMEADLIAIQEGRFEDKVGNYGVPAMNAVIGEEVC